MADEKTNEDGSSAQDVEVVDSWMWIKDARGFGSVTVTLMTIAFYVTTIAYVLSWFDGTVHGFKIRPFDVGAAASYFGTMAALYGGRKWTEAKYKTGQ